jgi:MYXO-CTERM domain-containing protein
LAFSTNATVVAAKMARIQILSREQRPAPPQPSPTLPLLVCPLLVLLASPALASDDHEDHHHMPPEYAAPGWSMPPVSFAEAEYPLAAQFVEADPSNFTAGGITEVQYVVVHTMQGYYEGSINWFLNPSADVSAHFCMRSEDGEITQMVGLDDRAWHVGNSNSYAIGIEHEGFVDDASWYTWATYRESAKLARWLADRFALPLDRDHIVGHVELPNQTHTDPGPHWDWELYMALVRDVVGAGVVEGVVVDPDRACAVTAVTDTVLTTTLEDPAALDDASKCVVPAGTELAVLHAGTDMIGKRRLVLADDSPCAELGDAFATITDFDAFCSLEELAVAGASVSLDGGAPIVVGADGVFSWTGVGAGAHAIDGSADGFESVSVPIDHAGYPGVRLVVRLPSTAAGDSTGGDPTAGDDGGDEAPDPQTTASTDGGDDDGTDTSAGDPEGDGDHPLPVTFGETEQTGGCGCRGGGSTGAMGLALPALLLLARRRRR